MPRLIGGALALDFVNTVDPRHAPGRREYLGSYPALLAWSRHAGTISAIEGERLLNAAAADPGQARRVTHQAITLREALYRVLAQATAGQPPAGDDLAVLHGELREAMTHIQISWSAKGFTWEWEHAQSALGRLLWPVARSAADLLVAGPFARIRECPGDDGTCGWLFLDHSKNATRQWCEMRTCGNRAKARRHHSRARAASQA